MPFSGSWDIGHRIAGAAALAVERVNADKALLPGRRFEYSWADSGCSAQKALAAMGELLRKASKVDAVIGPGCSAACKVTSYLSSGQEIPQISWGCASPKLSDKNQYHLFSRTTAPHSSKGPALIAFMQHNKWTRLVILTSTDEVYFESRLSLAKQLEDAGNSVLTPTAFEPGNIKDTMLREIRQSGIRIIAVLAYDADTQTVASFAYRDEMSAGFAWMLPRSEVSPVPALLGWIWVKPLLASEGMQAFTKQVSDYSKSHFSGTVSPDSVSLAYSVALYDAIMLYAHAATKVLSEGSDLQDGNAVTKAVRSTKFVGAGGQIVDLDESGDKIESYEVMNYVMGTAPKMRSEPFGMYNSTLQQYTAYEQVVVWPGRTTEVPIDYSSGAS